MANEIETKDLRQGAMLRAGPHDVYEMLMDSGRHSAFTDAKARISRKVGGRFTAYDGWIEGRNVRLVKDREIVQEWRGADWPEGHYSTVTITLKGSGSGTRLMLSQKGIPANKYTDIRDGWKEWYWERMKVYIAESGE